ncbi:PREDICTED: uncharacterized protein LOC108565885 [Nicrophorus vespilloides]|uniref:Uncharacterized protein LOC108565885 n=1 Tax=Nicrophorus vespilloides TaxID=110193 RepID=A0ABM1N2J8_NICVS|nr:PREDICTED: uncharacterized protein LOC108565885 [Nicrophorus vespilloides]
MLLLVLLFVALVSGCTIDVRVDIEKPQVLILKPGMNHGNDAFYWPTNASHIDINQRQVAVLACPGSNLIINNISQNYTQVDAKCLKNKNFNILGKTVQFNAINCTENTTFTARYTGNSCLNVHREIEAGFELEGGRFLRQIAMCFDSVNQDTLYSVYNLTMYNGNRQKPTRREFEEGNFYNVGPSKVNNLYKRNMQRKTINNLLGLPLNSTKYIDQSNDNFLSRGHMTANADFVYNPQQNITFYFVNVAPQWMTLNGYNWKYLEKDVRAYAANNKLDLVVYTGVHGVSTLPHDITGTPTRLYLYVNGNDRGLAVPQVYWKVLYNQKTKAGVAFVGLNNPYDTNTRNYIFCKDICSMINWLTWDRFNITHGYGYCCDVNDLRNTITNIPKFDVKTGSTGSIFVFSEMARSLIVLLLVASVTQFTSAKSLFSGCTVAVNGGLGKPETLILKPGEQDGNDAFYWPTNDDEIQFNDGDVAVLACPGGELIVKGTKTKESQAEAKCSGKSFTILGKSVAFKDIKCSRTPFHNARYTGQSCLGKHKEIEAGFELEDGRFLKQISICFDDVMQSSLYSRYNLTKNIEGYQSGYPRPDFVEEDFYNVGSASVNSLYSRNNQRKTINALVGLPASSYKYVSSSNDYFLSRGHLTAKADFVYGIQHRVTFYYVNVAPQWQTFNGRNWNTLEMDVRDYAGSKDLDLVVYTGTHGISTLPHEETGEQTELFLYVDGKEHGIPVPQLYWKVVHNPQTKAAVAFVGINNPYDKNVEDDMFCTSICDKIDWVNWKNNDIQMGYGYCCDVNELRKTIINIPDFEVTSILI